MSLEGEQRAGGTRSGRGVVPTGRVGSEEHGPGSIGEGLPHGSSRGVALATGVLLVVATVAVLVADAVEPDVDAMAAGRGSVALAALLRIIAAAASVGIAISLYPLLRLVGRAMAIGSVVFRTIEAVMYLAGVVALLTVASLTGRSPSLEGTPTSTVRAVVEVLTSVRREAGLVAVFAFAAGAFMYYALLYRARVVPLWLSGWGLLGVGLLFIASMLCLFSNGLISDYKLLAAPIFLQELVLGVWLLAKGFTPAGHPVADPLGVPPGSGADDR